VLEDCAANRSQLAITCAGLLRNIEELIPIIPKELAPHPHKLYGLNVGDGEGVGLGVGDGVNVGNSTAAITN
jgi:hypothetical protein